MVRSPTGSSSINFTTAHFGGEFYTTTPEATANSILFTRTATVNGRKMVFGSDLTYNSSTNILSIKDLAMNGKIDLNYTNNTTDSGIFYVSSSDTNFATYFAVSGTATSIGGGNAVSFGGVSSAIRMRVFDGPGRGFIFENSNEDGLMGLTGDNGDLTVLGDVNIGNNKTYKVNGTQISSANLSNDSSLQKISTNTYGNFINIGNLDIGTWNLNADFSMFRNSSVNGVGDYALLQSNAGATFLNSSNGQVLRFGINNVYYMTMKAGQLGVGSAASNPLSALHVIGIKQTNPTERGIHLGEDASNGNNAIEICQDTGTAGYIDFTKKNLDFKGRILYDHTGDNMYFYTSSTFKVGITSAGDVGIGVVSPSQKLEVNGICKASSFIPPSDDRLKKNETVIKDALSVINQLSCETYDKAKEILFIEDNKEQKIDWDLSNYNNFYKECGFIAQEVYQIEELKEYVSVGDDNKPWGVDYNSIFTYAVKAIQELSTKNIELENKISDLENENLSQNQYIDILESKISDLENNLNLIKEHLNLN